MVELLKLLVHGGFVLVRIMVGIMVIVLGVLMK